MAKLTFFIGKGGVGKTTVSSAYALHRARTARKPVILISTDPAHSLADVFQKKLGSKKALLRAGRGKLVVWQIDAQQQFEAFLDEVREPVLDLMEQGTFFSRKEIEPFLDSTLPGMAEVSALLAVTDLMEAGDYQEIVVDTAPMGHTLRLFQIPDAFLKVLEFFDVAAGRDRVLAETFAGKQFHSPSEAFLKRWNDSLRRLQEVMRSTDTSLTLVTSAETFSLNEAARAAVELAAGPEQLRVDRVVLNRIVRRPGKCLRCSQRADQADTASAFLARHFPAVDILEGEDPGSPILGTAPLLAFGAHVFASRRLRAAAQLPRAATVALRTKSWPGLQTPLHFTLGKGGVGKTTISAGLAVAERAAHAGSEVLVCSTDPAPSLDDVFRQKVGERPASVSGDKRLQAMEVDSALEYRAWASRLRDKMEASLQLEHKGVHIELSHELRLIEALMEIVPPGVDEVFAIFRITDLLAEGRKLIIDMAPTGHALELLRTPERLMQWSRLLLKALGAHRGLPAAQELAVEVAMISQKVRDLLKCLKDPGARRLSVVMLAEPLPDQETRRLMRELEALGLAPDNIFVNRILPEAGPCKRCRNLRHWQMATLLSLTKAFGAKSLLVVPEAAQPVAGKKALRAFTRTLWQVQEKPERRSRPKR